MSTNLECQLCSSAVNDGCGVNFRDLTRSVELFVISEQVMAEKIARENIYDVLGVADEF